MLRPTLSLLLLMLASACTPDALVHDEVYQKQSLAYWEKKSKAGDIEGMYIVGRKLCCGTGPQFKNREGMELLCKSARGGFNKAQFALGEIYREDWSWQRLQSVGDWQLPKNDVMAYTWYMIAAKNDSIDARSEQYKIADRLTARQLKQARDLAAQFPHIPCEINE